MLCILSSSVSAFAGAWLQEHKKMQAIYTKNFTIDNKFSNGYNDFYYEYGLKDKTIGTNVYIKNTDKKFRENYYKDDQVINLFIRKNLIKNHKYVISTEKIFYLKPAGYKHKLLIGKSFENNLKPFVNIELSLHKNYIDPINLKSIFTAGFHFSDKLMFISESINSYRYYKFRAYKIENDTDFKTIIYKKGMSKIAFSLVYELDNTYSIQMGYSDRLHKKYRDKSIFTAVWLKL